MGNYDCITSEIEVSGIQTSLPTECRPDFRTESTLSLPFVLRSGLLATLIALGSHSGATARPDMQDVLRSQTGTAFLQGGSHRNQRVLSLTEAGQAADNLRAQIAADYKEALLKESETTAVWEDEA